MFFIDNHSIHRLMRDLPHRKQEHSKLQGIGILTWYDILNIFSKVSNYTVDEFEKLVAKQVRAWLSDKISKF